MVRCNLVLAFMEDLFFFIGLFKIYSLSTFIYVVCSGDTMDESFCLNGAYVLVEVK